MRRFSPILLALLGLAGCDDAPKSAPPPSTRATAPAGQLPANHPPLEAPKPVEDASQFAGRVVLLGALAEATTGALFVTLHPAGQRMPIWSYKVDLDDPDAAKKGLAAASGGKRELTFALNQKTTLFPGSVPHGIELELAILYDPDKSVDSKEGQVRAAVPAKPGDLGLYLELDPDASK